MEDRSRVDVAAPVSDDRIEEFGHWLNGWGSLDARPERRSRDWREGYEQAIRDAYDRFNAAYPKWANGGIDRG